MIVPRYTTAIRGRSALLQQLQPTLPEPGLTTLWGPGGVGKTRLACELALRARRSEQAVWFVPVVEDADADTLIAALIAALELPAAFHPGRTRLDRIVRWLDRAHVPLLVIDEAELASAAVAEVVAHLQEHARPLHLLVTSRVPLGLSGEALIEVALLEAGPAAELFRDAAPRDTFVEQDAIARVVEQLDGLPLAIELAASRLEVLPMAQLEQRLRDPLPVLRDPLGVGRHGTLWRSLDASWQALPPWARPVLGQLSVFAHDVALDAAEAVLVPPDGPDAPTILDGMHLLARRAVLRRVEGGGPDDPPRFRLAPFVRAFLADRLGGPAADAIARHAVWHGARAIEELCARHDGTRDSAWLERGESELVLALQRSLDGAAPPETAVQCAAALLFGGRSVAWRLELADRVLEWIEGAGAEHDRVALAKLYEGRGSLRARRADTLGSLRDHERALQLVQASGPLSLQAHLLGLLGNRLYQNGRDDEGLQAFRRALELAEEAQSHSVAARVVVALSLSEDWQHAWRPERSLQRLQHAIAQTPQAAVRTQLNNSHRLSMLLLILGRPDEALAHIEATVSDVAPWLLDQAPYAHQVRGEALFLLGRLDEAIEALERSREIACDLGYVYIQAESASYIVLIHLLRRQLEAAGALLTEALAQIGGGPPDWRTYELSLTVLLTLTQALRGEAEASTTSLLRARALAEAELAEPVYLGCVDFVESGLELIAMRDQLRAGGAIDPCALRTALDRFDAIEPRYLMVLRLARSWIEQLVEDIELLQHAWTLWPDGSSFAPPGAEPVPTARYKAVSRILGALATARLEAPGTSLDPQTLVAAGWPGQRLLDKAARNRLYVALNTLRRLGVTILQRIDEGYRLDPDVPARRGATDDQDEPTSR